MSRHLDTVVELQGALRDLRQARELLEGGPPALRELATEHGERRNEIAALEAEREESDKLRRAAEAESQDAQAKLDHFQAQIHRVTTQREYGALLKEIDTVKSRIHEAEDEGLNALERIDELDGRLSELRQSFEELDGRFQTTLAEWEREKPDVIARAERLEGQIEVFRERLPKPVLAQFERLYDRLQGEALAPVSVSGGGAHLRHCGHCNYRIRPQVVVEIQNEGSLIPCDSCHRILYLVDGG